MISKELEVLNYFSEFIKRELGIIYNPDNHFQLKQRLERIAILSSFGNYIDFYEHILKSGMPESIRILLLDTATNNETSFFRDRLVFENLKKTIIPALANKRLTKTQPFYIWSAASSSGQEAYSIAMICHELKLENPEFPNFTVYGSDVSESILAKAKSKTYSHLEVQRGLSVAQLVKYFDQIGDDEYRIKDTIAQHVEFSKQNLLNLGKPPRLYDIILCRNVLIYQNQENKIKILRELTKFLNPNGHMILGSAESLFGVDVGLTQEIDQGTVTFTKKRA